MPKFDPQKYNRNELRRAGLFKQKMLENGLRMNDVKDATGLSYTSICSFAYGRIKQGKVADWTREKFGDIFMQELSMALGPSKYDTNNNAAEVD